MNVRRFRNRFIQRIETLLKKPQTSKEPELLEISICMASGDGKDWNPAAYCDAYRTGSFTLDDGLLSEPDVESFRHRYPYRGYWDESDVSIWGCYSRWDRERLFSWLQTMYLRHRVTEIEQCFINFMKEYEEKENV